MTKWDKWIPGNHCHCDSVPERSIVWPDGKSRQPGSQAARQHDSDCPREGLTVYDVRCEMRSLNEGVSTIARLAPFRH